MRMMCEILLEKSTITAGEEIKGEIQYSLSSEIHVTNIIVIIYGKAMRMRRLPSRPFSNEDPPKTHSEIVFYEQFALLGNYEEERSEREEELILPVGISKLPIKVKIPVDAPSSFCYKHVSIYSIIYTIEIYRYATYEKWRDAAMVFDVIAPINLSMITLAREPLIIDKDLNHFCCCLPIGNVIINGNLPKTGYLAGSSIEFNLECSNQTYFGIDLLQIFLRLEIKFSPYNKNDDIHYDDNEQNMFRIKVGKIDISKTDFGSIQSGELRKFQRTLNIPPIEPLNVDKSKMFSIKYYLVFKMIFPFPLPSLTEKFPIIIGNMSSPDDDPTSPRRLMFIRNINEADRIKLKQKLLRWNQTLIRQSNEIETNI